MYGSRRIAPVVVAAAAVALGGGVERAIVRPAPDASTLTARVVVPTVARAAPRLSGRARVRLTGVTAYSRSAQRLMVTALRRGSDGRDWVQVQLPVRPVGTTGWVRRDAVLLRAIETRVVVRLDARRLELWRGRYRLGRWRAGIGRPGTPTPVGVFAVQDAVRTLGPWRLVYGGHTIALTAHSRVVRRFAGGDGLVAIHGAGDGGLGRVGRPSSHGCVILGESALALVARVARAGTPVVIAR